MMPFKLCCPLDWSLSVMVIFFSPHKPVLLIFVFQMSSFGLESYTMKILSDSPSIIFDLPHGFLSDSESVNWNWIFSSGYFWWLRILMCAMVCTSLSWILVCYFKITFLVDCTSLSQTLKSNYAFWWNHPFFRSLFHLLITLYRTTLEKSIYNLKII